MSRNSIRMNYSCKKMDSKRDAGLTTPDDVSRVDDILYGTSRRRQILDIYRPKQYDGKLPVIINVHGGGWVYGTKETYQFYCMDLARRGFAVVNYNYRLAPRYKYPCPLEDTNTVMHWVIKHASEYDLDIDRLFAVGDSAGAQILAQYACIITNKTYAQRFTFLVPDGLEFKALGLNCGVYNMESKDSSIVECINDYIPASTRIEQTYEACPYRFITKDFPPSFVVTSNEDFLKNDVPLMTDAFESQGVRYVYKLYGDEENILYHVFHVNIRTEAARICSDEQCEFFLSVMN